MFTELHGLTKRDLLTFFRPKAVFSFEILATSADIKFYIFCPHHLAEQIKDVIHGAYREAEIQQVPDYHIFAEDGFVDSTRIMVKGPLYAPTQTYPSFTVDPLNSLTNKMADLEKGESLLVECIERKRAVGRRIERSGVALK